jgi:polyferredoxin
MSLASLFSERGLQGLLAFLLFGFLAVIFGHSWCGWVCPFGLIQDALAGLRKKLKIREALFTAKTRKLLRVFKYSLLFYLIVTPILVTLGLAHPDLSLPFCSICPAKIIMPALAGNFNWLALDFTNLVLFINSLILIVFTGVTLVGAFFKDRFFCLVCPLPLLIHIFKPIFLLKLTKEPRACLGCATCQRLCPVDLDASTKERRRGDFQASGCQGCFVCVQNCGSDGSLAVKVGPKTIYKSSRRP